MYSTNTFYSSIICAIYICSNKKYESGIECVVITIKNTFKYFQCFRLHQTKILVPYISLYKWVQLTRPNHSIRC